VSDELERRLLAAITNAEVMQDIHDLGVRRQQFEQPLYGAVFGFIEEYWDLSQRRSIPTEWALTQEFTGYQPHTEETDEVAYLCQLMRTRFVTNQLQEMMRDATKTMDTDPIGTLRALHTTAYEASEAVAPRLTRMNMADTIDQFWESYEAEEAYPQGIGVPFGLDLFDLHTGGLQPGELAVVGAFAKVGKTMFGLNACAQASKQGYRPLVYTLEMSMKECEKRLTAMISGVSYNRLLHRQLSDTEKDTVRIAQEKLKAQGGIQIERPDEGDRTVASLLSRARQYGTDYLFIDQLSFMEPGRKTDTLKEHHSAIIKQLKNEITRSGLEIPCILAAQLRRDDEEISIKSFSNATEIEATADILLGLSRSQDLYNNHLMKLDILGARRSDRASYLLTWELTEATTIKMYKEV
jgi:replicative DNA helicase